ncbi:dehydrocholesterol reductase [Seminavis robusta]|uniref:7-dehydrocholesterol reductase n=1 Tax=Seminavis robusta TaxID=568900 RepID=A0A9N8HK82_9STRA|nr:dehydrocholesterol reductase [Seminavis robusta]|eukprot:Sro817_g206760.1 dehydrocholesterol reductase (503) ;mRNA; r:4859-6367
MPPSELRQRNTGAAYESVLSSTSTDGAKTAAAEAAATVRSEHASNYSEGTNFVEGGFESNPILLSLCVAAPFTSLLMAHVTSQDMATQYPDMARYPISGMLAGCMDAPVECWNGMQAAAFSASPQGGMAFILSFMAVALVLERLLPGKIEYGPETATGHVPRYVDNGVPHFVVYTILFFLGSNLGVANLYDFGIMYDLFPESLAFLNVFGIVFCLFLTYKGIYFPSTQDSGSSGSFVKDYLWGTELYPQVFGLDLKRFINCRFSMTFWMLAGFSYCYRSYTLHGQMDWGLFFSALSQYLYLVKFFFWEMGYMRSIDIIVDRAGFEIQWGCLVYVPAVYTFHTRFLVQHPSGFSFAPAFVLFCVSMAAVVLNYMADREREIFRATNGQALVWGKPPKYIEAYYTITDRKTRAKQVKKSLLLASGFWGTARHFQYFFELTAAWTWCLLANPIHNGGLPLSYAVFLTILLTDRAERDAKKCHAKYGKYYDEYCELVPYKILPGVY